MTNLCYAPGWTALSLSDYGEIVMCYNEDDVFVTAKARTLQSSVGLEKIEEIYLKRLEEEVIIINTFAKTRSVNGNLWSLKVYDICSKVARYVLHACALIDGYYCIIEATLLSAEDYFSFMQKFDEFCCSINFMALRREIGSLKCNAGCVTATGLSDVTLRNRTDTTMLFTGRNKYFVVSVSGMSQQDMLNKAVIAGDLKIKSESETSIRYNVCDNTGTIELYHAIKGDTVLEVFGYWSNDSTDTIADNLFLDWE